MSDEAIPEWFYRAMATPYDEDVIEREFPELIDARAKLIEDNFAQRDLFLSPSVIETEREERLRRVLQPKITIQTESDESPFS